MSHGQPSHPLPQVGTFLGRSPDKQEEPSLQSPAGDSLYILKWHRQEGADREFSILTKAHRQGLQVPKPLDLWPGRAILMAYIPGENLCDLISKRPSPRPP